MAIRTRLDVRDAARARGVDRRRAVPGRATLELPRAGLARAGTRMAGQLGPPSRASPARVVHAAAAADDVADGPATSLGLAAGRRRHPPVCPISHVAYSALVPLRFRASRAARAVPSGVLPVPGL